MVSHKLQTNSVSALRFNRNAASSNSLYYKINFRVE